MNVILLSLSVIYYLSLHDTLKGVIQEGHKRSAVRVERDASKSLCTNIRLCRFGGEVKNIMNNHLVVPT